MRPRFLVRFMRVVLYLALAATAYLTGRWQGTLAVEAPPTPRERSPLSIALAARTAARAAAYAKYLAIQKRVESELHPHPAADINLADDSKGGLEKLAKLPTGAKTQAMYRDAFATWAKNPRDAPDAATAALALPVGLERTAALKGLTEGWAESDAKASLDWASSLLATEPDLLEQAMIAVGSQNNDSWQPALAAQYLDKLPDASARNQAIKAIGTNWGNGFHTGGEDPGPADALAWLDQVATGETYDSTITAIFSGLDQVNPIAAANLIDKVTEPDVRSAVLTHMLTYWNANPEAALSWAQNLPDADQAVRDQALPLIINNLAKSDPAAAAAFVQQSHNPAIFQQNIAGIAQNFASVDPQAALVWTNSLPDGDVKNQALSSVLVSLSASDFTSAWNDAANLTDTDTATTILGNLVVNLAKKNPAQATAQIGQLATEAAQVNAASRVASTWVLADSAGFSAWANTLPPGSEHDAAVAAAMKALQNAKLPAPERASLTEALTRALQPNPTP